MGPKSPAPGGGGGASLEMYVVSRFFGFPIQMNFAENQKWPTSVGWRGGPARELGGYVRAGGQSSNRPAAHNRNRTTVPYLEDFHWVVH